MTPASKRVVAFVIGIACAGAALADEFEGGYFGVNAGGFRARTATTQSIDKPIVGFVPSHGIIVAGVADANASPSETSGLGGIHMGYAKRVGYLLPGIEADLNYWGYKKTAQSELPFDHAGQPRTIRVTNQGEATTLMTIRPRIGFNVSSHAIAHVSGGLAFANLKQSNVTEITSENPPDAIITYRPEKKSYVGWVVGAGYEHRWTDKLNLRIDYQYIDFGRVSATDATTDPNAVGTDLESSSVTANFHTTVHVLRLGVNWRF